MSKLPPDFSRLQFSTFLGGKGMDSPPEVAVDGVGQSIAGSAFPGHPLVKPIQSEWRLRLLYLTKLNTGGSALLFSTYFGGTWIPAAVVNFSLAWKWIKQATRISLGTRGARISRQRPMRTKRSTTATLEPASWQSSISRPAR